MPMTLHPTGLFEFESIDWSAIDLSMVIYAGCVMAKDVGGLKAGAHIQCVRFRVDSFVLEFVGKSTVLQTHQCV